MKELILLIFVRIVCNFNTYKKYNINSHKQDFDG